MSEMNSASTDSSSLYVEPKNVTFMGSVFANFRFPTAMSVGDVSEIKTNCDFDITCNRYFKFLLKKTSEETVSILCERHIKDWTLKADSVLEQVALEPDDGCFLRLYISVIGVNEKPKSAVLRSTDTSASVEFKEDSFLNPKVDVDYVYVLKCVFRKIETTILPNEEQEAVWQQRLSKACKSNRQRKNMAFVLKRPNRHKRDMSIILDRPNLDNVLTGRSNEYVDLMADVVCRACCYHEELVQYLQAKENSKSIPKNKLGLILGYLYNKEKRPITKDHCVELYLFSHRSGLKFLKILCVVYMTENLLDSEFVADVLRVADLTEDSRLFNAAWLFCRKNMLQLFNSYRWQLQAVRCANISDLNISPHIFYNCLNRALSIVHGLLLRCFTDSHGFPPAMEDETAQP